MASGALLAQIQSGRQLKKAVTNDRSAPLVDGVKASVGGGGGGGGGRSALSNGSGVAGGGGGGGSGGPPPLGGLFAGGMPKLKPPSASTQSKITNLVKPPQIPRNGGSNAATSVPFPGSPIPPPAPPPPPSGPPSTISRSVPPPPSRTVPPPAGPGRVVPPPPITPTSSTITRAVPPPPTRSTTVHAPPPPPPAAPHLPARSVPPPPPTSPPPSQGRAVPPPPSRILPLSSPSSTTVEAPNSAINNVYGRTPTSANGRESPIANIPARSVPPPPSASGRKVPPPPPPRGGAGAGSMSDTAASPRRLAPPPPSARPLSAGGTGPPSRQVPPPTRTAPPPTRTAPPPVRIAPSQMDGAPTLPSRERGRVQSAVSPTSGVSDMELENAIVARISQDGPGVGMGPPPVPSGRRGHGRAVSGGPGGAPTLPRLDFGGHQKTGSWSRSAAGAPPRSSSYAVGNQNQRSAMANSGLKRIPSPPPTSGEYRFPASSDFPAPRVFQNGPKNYPSGRSKGSDFDLSIVG